jgi:phage terminase large subunit GpA-like protein
VIVRQAFLSALEPPPSLTVSEWADAYRMLSAEASAEPGRWSTARAPYQRAIMDAFNDPLVETIVVMSSSQVGKSEQILNILGYQVDLDPAPILVVQPTLAMAEAFSKDRLATMIRDTPALRAKFRLAKRDAANTVFHKTFSGGHITLAGSNSPASLASRPVRMVLGDEVDRWEVTSEGDPLALARKRAVTFWNRKYVWVSTPTIKNLSRIERLFLTSDQRRCFLPCPHCHERFVLEWRHVRWDTGQPETAHLVCPTCGCLIDEAGRAQMLRDPEWRATAPFHGVAGFAIWEAYSPWRRLSDIALDFLEAEKAADTLQVWVNTSLGQTWEERDDDETPKSLLIARREEFAAEVPAGACYLTAGVDVQDDRLEVLVIGWGPGEESWVVDARVLPGDPQLAEPWEALDEVLTNPYQHESGAQLHVAATCIDTGGHRTQFAYDYAKKHQHQAVYAVKGRAGSGEPIVSAPVKKRSGRDPRKVPLYIVGVDGVKALIYSRLKTTKKGVGYIHLPLEHDVAEGRFGVDEEFIEQLLAERLVTKHRAGVPTRTWVPVRPRNEALDMFVYAIAALRLQRPNLVELAARMKAPPTPPPALPPPGPAQQPWITPRPGWLRGGAR